MIGIYKEAGLSDYLAEYIGLLEDMTSKGSEERLSNAVQELTGREPIKFVDFVKENAGLWA